MVETGERMGKQVVALITEWISRWDARLAMRLKLSK